MSKTKQGSFDTAYHHIEAPTIRDDEYWAQHHKNKLAIPSNGQDEVYRSPLLAYLADNPWVYSRKVDGENIRIQWDGEQALWNGKTNKFQCSTEFADYMNNTFLEEIFEEKFGRDKIVTIFGEKMGPKTQGNELGLGKDEVIIYDVNVNGTWLSGISIFQIAHYFNCRSVYEADSITKRTVMVGTSVTNYYGTDTDSLYNLIQRCANGEFKEWEGIVAAPLVEMRDQQGHRVIVKIKNRDYLREGEVKND